MADHWFTIKTHGYGVSPANWKGWAATGVYVLAEMAIILWMVLIPTLAGIPPGVGRLVVMVILLSGLTVVYFMVLRAKSDGEWRWRWNSRKGD